jgi:hypothetical protein
MLTLLFAAAVVTLLGGALFWAAARARRLRAEAQAREQGALAAVLGGGAGTDGDTIFGGLPARIPARGGIEVVEVVDLDALLAGEPGTVAHRARAQLEEPTNIDIGGMETMPPLLAGTSLSPLSARAPVVRMPPAVPRPVAPRVGAAPAAPPASARPSASTPLSSPQPSFRPGPAPTIARTTAPSPARASSPAPAPTFAPAGFARVPAAVPAPAAAAVPSLGPALAGATVSAAASRPVAPPPSHLGHDVPLRELALAWFEARGYRSTPASAVVRPIELVLRHKDDPARAYAFVVESNRVSNERVQNLRAQARAIGLVRLLIVASDGAAPRAADGFKGVRLMDRATLEAEFKQLDFSVAAKIIAVARKRSGALAAVS